MSGLDGGMHFSGGAGGGIAKRFAGCGVGQHQTGGTGRGVPIAADEVANLSGRDEGSHAKFNVAQRPINGYQKCAMHKQKLWYGEWHLTWRRQPSVTGWISTLTDLVYWNRSEPDKAGG